MYARDLLCYSIAYTGAGKLIRGCGCREVKGALVDPSCSGSGTVLSRMDHLLPSFVNKSKASAAQCAQAGQESRVEDAEGAGALQSGAGSSETDRIEKLAAFQEAAVRHALQLPALQRLVYSTCSVHERENEAVVAAVLPEAQELGFWLVDPFPEWSRRGIAGAMEGADKLVRVDPVADETDGFFIAVFERVEKD